MALNKITVDSLAANAVTNVAIANGTITAVDLSDSGVSAGVYGDARKRHAARCVPAATYFVGGCVHSSGLVQIKIGRAHV